MEHAPVVILAAKLSTESPTPRIIKEEILMLPEKCEWQK